MERDEAFDLLCASLRDGDQSAAVERLGRLSPTEWETLLHQARLQEVHPLLYDRLKALETEAGLPQRILEHLQEAYLQNAARNMRLYHELSRVLALFKREKIPVVVLKGGYLAECVYRSIALRSLNDIDLLIRHEDYAKAQRLLLAQGYGPGNPRLPLEIHWNIIVSIADLSIDINGVWQRARPAHIAHTDVFILAPEDLVLHLCLHLAAHHLFRCAALRTMVDLREVLRHPAITLQGEALRQRSDEWGGWNAVCLSLSLARELMGAVVSPDITRAIALNDCTSQRAWAIDRMVDTEGADMDLSPYFWQLWKPGSWREKLSSLWTLLWPPRNRMAQKYPVSGSRLHRYAYYGVRLKNHALKYLRAVWRILMRDAIMRAQIQHQRSIITMREWLVSGVHAGSDR